MPNIINDLFEIANKLNLSHSNEAETRFKLIDRVLKDILKWTHDDISVEDRVIEDGKTTYSDYIIKTANTAFIVEAKKIGTPFTFNKTDERRMKLSTTNLVGDIGSAITQARDYCRKLSIQFAVVTNGCQWIIFPANRIDQVSFNNSYAIVFDSIDSILKADYQDFYDLLSREAVINSSLENSLLGYTEDQSTNRRLRNYYRNNRNEGKNAIYPLIETAITTAFSDSIIELEPSLFEKCYVNSSDKIKFDRKINMHISKSAHLFKAQPIRPMQKTERDNFKKKLLEAQTRVKPLAIIILGSVGAGKTTFLHYTKNISSASFFEKTTDSIYPHWIYINFLNYTNDITPADFIYQNIKQYMIKDPFFKGNSCVTSAYQNEIDAIREGPANFIAQDEAKFNELITNTIMDDYNKVKPYVDKLLKFHSIKFPIFLVIDNVDQLDEKVQSIVFTESIAFSQKLNLNLSISLRSSTYVQHRSSASFNAFDFDPILIEPPKIEAVLSKRFFLAESLLEGKSGEFTSERGAKISVNNLSTIIKLMQSSILGTEVGGLLEVLAAGDTRNALRITREFIEHGYSNPGRAYSIYNSSGKYTLPRHEALRAILLGNQPVYNEDFSAIGNPLDSRLNRTNLQLIRLFVLSGLVQYSTDSKFQYLEGIEIQKNLRTIGIGDESILTVLNDLCKFRFILTAEHDEPKFNSNYYPSRLGGYIVRDLISNFMFLENMMMDTFIADTQIWGQLSSLSKQIINTNNDKIARLDLRIERITIFYNYMMTLYSALVEESIKRVLPREWHTNPLKEGLHLLEKNLQTAKTSALKNYGRKRFND